MQITMSSELGQNDSEASEQRIRQSFRKQAMFCERLRSPLTALICSLASERLNRTTQVGDAILSWRGAPEPEHDALALRFAAGLHAVAQTGQIKELSECYTTQRPPREEQLWEAVEVALSAASDELLKWLKTPPQTNEVGRSAILTSGILVALAVFPLPIKLLEIGTSAGLNLLLDRYHHRLGRTQAGDKASPVRLAPKWSGDSPPSAAVSIAERAGVDLNPLNVTSRVDRDRLVAFTWADQLTRLRKLQAALKIAQKNPPPVMQGNAIDWLKTRLGCESGGHLRVVMHSFVQQYFTKADQEALHALMNEAGQVATESSPLAWLSLETDVTAGRPALVLQLWPSGERVHLCWCAGHGQQVQWTRKTLA